MGGDIGILFGIVQKFKKCLLTWFGGRTVEQHFGHIGAHCAVAVVTFLPYTTDQRDQSGGLVKQPVLLQYPGNQAKPQCNVGLGHRHIMEWKNTGRQGKSLFGKLF